MMPLVSELKSMERTNPGLNPQSWSHRPGSTFLGRQAQAAWETKAKVRQLQTNWVY